VHTITISAEQHAHTQRRIAEVGLTDLVVAELRDYRELDGNSQRYDAIISVEMIEAVGEDRWPLYLSILDDLLTPSGKVGLQIITMRHDRFLLARNTQSWVNKHVMPGFLLPSPEAIESAIAEHTRLSVLDKFAFGQHFVATLRLWHERLINNARSITDLGLDGTFQRTWSFFLASSEAGFRAKHFDIYHYVLDRQPEAKQGAIKRQN
jgi:cyclopropane-fatty-acyl-phospholipid synthase